MRRRRRPPLETRIQRARTRPSRRMNIGIDLGTTNSALAYIDPRRSCRSRLPADSRSPHRAADRRQRVSGTLRTLPSFLYLSDPPVVGAYARDQGALLPTKTVHSAKSWLSNSEADRTAKILPWDSQEEGRVLSPVEASARYLAHLREAWDRAKANAARRAACRAHRSRQFRRRSARADGRSRPRRPASTISRCSKSRPRPSTPGSPVTSPGRTRNCSISQMCWSAMSAAAPATSLLFASIARAIASSSPAPRSAAIFLLGGDNLDLTISWLAESKFGNTLSLRQRSAFAGSVPRRKRRCFV